jgi:Asp-tRNA(Asn)/Glu-tRNA(Gln) amidotransferase A subunit family amidase
MARSIFDVAAALEVVIGPDPSDLGSLPKPEASYLDAMIEPRLPARVGWSPDLGYAPVDREVLAACESALATLDDLGVEVVEISGPFDEDCVDSWLTIVGSCLARSMAHLADDERYDKTDPILRMIVDGGAGSGGVDLVRALDEAHLLNLRLVEMFHNVRLLLTPTMAGVVPPSALGGLGLINGETDVNWVRMTYPFNMTRSPASSVCVGVASSGVPIGMQVVGPQHADLAVLRATGALELAIGFSDVAAIG